MKYRLKNIGLDYIIVGIVLILSICFSLTFYLAPRKGTTVAVYIMGNKEITSPLDEDSHIILLTKNYNCLLADMTIEIKDSKVRVEKEESPRHRCSRQGWVSTPNLPIVCLPNSVMVIIESDTDSEFDAGIGAANGVTNAIQ